MCTEYHSRFCLISRGAGLTEALGQDREFQGRQSTTDDQRHEQECVGDSRRRLTGCWGEPTADAQNETSSWARQAGKFGECWCWAGLSETTGGQTDGAGTSELLLL